MWRFSRIPGRVNDRRTPLGELNWIFTAVTDTIAWNTLPRGVFSFVGYYAQYLLNIQLHAYRYSALPRTHSILSCVLELFQKLFRQDLLVASLFRNFLLAERIMRSYNCNPMSSPKLPPTYQHPMWWAVLLEVIMRRKNVDLIKTNVDSTWKQRRLLIQRL